jgi:hypothetical protein
MRAVDLLGQLADDVRAGGVCELTELAQVVVDGAASARSLERRAHEERALLRRCDDNGISAYEKILVKFLISSRPWW